MTTEVDFAKNFIQLVSVSGDSTQTTFDLSAIQKLPPYFTLPPLVNPYISENHTNVEDSIQEKTVEITFKSLRQPKFNVVLPVTANSTTTVYSVKLLLIESLKTEFLIDAANLKLMLRTKTLQDSEYILNHITEDKASFNVLISTFEKPTTLEEHVASVSEETWSKISKLLFEDLHNQEKVNNMIDCLKRSLN